LLVGAAPAAAQPSDVVISQFRTQGPGGDFVEIQNVSTHVVNLGPDWNITSFDPVISSGCTVYGDYTNPSSIPQFNAFRPPVSLMPGQRFLTTQPNNWSGTGDAATDESFHAQSHGECGDLRNTAGILSLNLGTNVLTGGGLGFDQVAYGPIPGQGGTPPDPFWGPTSIDEPDPIPAASVPSDGSALRRKLGGTQDTGSNKNDFVTSTADPKNSVATAPAPNASTTAPTSIAAKSATLNGTANPHRAIVTDCKFQIDTTGTYTSPTVIACAPVTPAGQTDIPVTGAATGLTPDTLYHYRIVVTTAKGTVQAVESTVRTNPPDPPPDGSTQPATIVNAMSATLNGKINPRGGTVSDCHFEYAKTAPTSGPSLQAPCAPTPAGLNLVDVTASVLDLDPSSDYAYHVVATTQNGTFTGGNATFHTGALGTADTDKIVISQFRSRGAGGDFVELSNVTNSSLTMAAGWSIGASTANSGCTVVNQNTSPQVTLAPGQHYLIGGVAGADRGFASTSGVCSGGVPDANAMLSMFATDPTSGLLLSLDSAAYGDYLSASEGPAVAVVPSDGKALRRRSNGTQDTHRNADDFTVVTASPTGLSASSPAPTVTTGAATALLQTTVTLNGTVNPQGGTVTDCHFEYKADSSVAPRSNIPCATTPGGTSASAVTAAVSGLSPSTDYHGQLLVTTSGHTSVSGDDLAFRTADPLPVPTGATEDPPKPAAASTATLKASVNPHGAGVSDCHFDFGTSTNYGASVPCTTTPSGSNAVSVLGLATDLDPLQTYHYRIRVTGDNGSLTGDDSSFKTAALVPDDDAIVISQLRTQGVPNGDFVELLNVSGDSVDLPAGGWSITSLAPDGNSACSVLTQSDSPAVTLAPGQHYLTTQSGWTGTGTSASDLAFSTGGGTCGGVRDSAGVLYFSSFFGGGDSVAYGPLAGHNGVPAPLGSVDIPEPDGIPAVPTDGKALQRRDNGTRDTHNNYDDFHVVTATPIHFLPVTATAITDDATSIGSAQATFQGRVRPQGETISGCQFVYGTDAEFATGTPYPHSAACNTTPSGLGTVAVSATKTNLTPSTGYHFKLLAHGATTGDMAGAARTFTTPDPPTASTDSVDTIGSRSARLHGTVNPRGETVTDCHFDYGPTGTYTSTKACSSIPSGTGDFPVGAALTGLAPSTGYQVRVHITTSVAGERTGGDQTFTTTTTPAATTSDPTAVGNTIATLNGKVNPRGETVTDCHFEYGPDGSYGSSKPCSSTPSGLDQVDVSAQLSGLPSTTGYHYRLVVKTSGAPATALDGGDRQFTTTTPPSATIGDFGSIGSRSAALSGSVNPHGETVTQCRFEYSIDGSYSSFVPCVESTPFSGTADKQVSAALTGLAPSTDYNVRLFVVTSSSGRVEGGARTLSTTTIPSAATDAAGDVSHRSATLTGTVNPRGETVTDCHFDYGPTVALGSSKPCAGPLPSGVGTSPVSAGITGLTPGTGYHVHLVVTTNGSATPIDGGDQQFSTADPASAATDAAGDVVQRSATLKGTVNPHGEAITDCHFDYGPTGSYGSSVPCASTPSGAGSSPVASAVAGLSPSTGYHYRLVITTVGAPIDGGDQQFSTSDPASATTDPASGVAITSATLNGTVDPRGETITDCHFEYGTTTAYGSSAPCASTPSGSGASPVSAAVGGLSAATGYHYRLVIAPAGSGGSIGGADAGFTTEPANSAPEPVRLTAEQLALATHLKGTKIASAGGLITLGRVTCPTVCGKLDVVGTSVLGGAAAGRKQVIANGSASVTRGHPRTLRFQLVKRGGDALKRAHKLTLAVTVKLTQAGGRTVKVTRPIVVKLKLKH
jgi:phosphodiesterase/alkaline phosphatase D-like protein